MANESKQKKRRNREATMRIGGCRYRKLDPAGV